jgi:hypothetical protein
MNNQANQPPAPPAPAGNAAPPVAPVPKAAPKKGHPKAQPGPVQNPPEAPKLTRKQQRALAKTQHEPHVEGKRPYEDPVHRDPMVEFHRRASEYTPSIGIGDTVLREKFKTLGMKVHETSYHNNLIHAHPVSAGVRGVLTARALGEAFKLAPLVIDLYGSQRDWTIFDHLRKGLPVDHLRLYGTRPVITSADILRTIPRQYDLEEDQVMMAIEKEPACTCFLMVDIYHGDAGPLTPATVASHLRRQDYLFWIGHYFNGEMGGVHDEGAWLRSDGAIRFKPDASALEYAAHDPCDWLWEKRSAVVEGRTLVWSVQMTLGNMRLVKFKIVESICEDRADTVKYYVKQTLPVYSVPAWIEWLDLNALYGYLPDWIKHRLTPGEEVTYHLRLFNQLREFLSHRNHTTLTLKQTTSRYSELIKTDPEYQILLRTFPNEVQKMFENTILAAFIFEIEYRGKTLEQVRRQKGEALSKFNENLTKIDTPIENASRIPRWQWMLVVVAAVVFVMRRFRNRPQSSVALDLWLKQFSTKITNFLFTLLPSWFKRFCTFVGVDPFKMLNLCVLTPIWEEIVKKHPVGLAAIVGIETIDLVSKGESNLSVCVHAFDHCLMESYPLPLAMFYHSIWNFFCLIDKSDWCGWLRGFMFWSQIGVAVYRRSSPASVIGVANRWTAFKQLAYEEPWENRYFWDSHMNNVEVFKPNESQIPQQVESFYSPPKDPPCDLLKKTGKITVEVDPVPRTFTSILPTCVPTYQPANTNLNLLSVMESRVLLAPPLHPRIQAANWAKIHPPCLHWKSPLELDDAVNDWLDHFSSAAKRRSYKRAYQEIVENGFCHQKAVPVMVKKDEVLLKLDLENGRYQMRPRAISVVPQSYQIFVGPSLWAASKRLAHKWNWNPEPLHYGGWSIYVTYGASLTDKELTLWASVATQRIGQTASILVAGDDSVVVVGGSRWIEGDMRMLDQSISSGPLRFEYKILAHLGVHKSVLRELENISSLPYLLTSRDRTERIKIDRSDRHMRDTGCADTSLGNTIVVIYVWMEWLIGGENAIQSLGLSVKIREKPSIDGITFLKGMWYRVNSPIGYHWGPLPSRVLKVGKALRDPREIYGIKDRTQACRNYLSDVAQSYAVFLQVPVLRGFCKHYARYPKTERHHEELWVVAAEENLPLIMPEAYEQLYERYALEKRDFDEMEKHFDSGEPFRFLEHPGYFRMAEIDYS